MNQSELLKCELKDLSLLAEALKGIENRLLVKIESDKWSAIDAVNSLSKMIDSVYSCIEKILRYRLQLIGVDIRKSDNWHADILSAAVENGFLRYDEETLNNLKRVLGVRHKMRNSYGHSLSFERLVLVAEFLESFVGKFINDQTAE